MLKTSAVAAALLAAAPFASAGSASIKNNCDYEVHLWTADTQRGERGPELISSGGSWVEEYFMVGSGSSSDGGVSIKLATTPSCDGAITQFEYTLSSNGTPDLWYDISNVNCEGNSCPFFSGGFHLDAPTEVTCGPETVNCKAVYNVWNDDIATHGTTSSKDLTLYLCGKDGKGSNEVKPDTPTPTKVVVSTPIITPPPTPAKDNSPDVDIDNIITEIETEYVTQFATAWASQNTPAPESHRHKHRRRHGHPHWRK